MTKQISIQMKSQSSQEINQEIQALLPPRVASSLESVCDPEWDVIAYTVEGAVPLDEISESIKIIERFMVPLKAKDIAKLLTEVYVLTKRRKDDQVELDFAVLAYGSRLMEYPGDIVAEVLKGWPDKSTWFPSWHELKKTIDRRNDREKMLKALVKKLQPKGSDVTCLISNSIRKP